MKAIVLHSGGLDSTVALAKAIWDGANEVISFGVKYGSRHNEAEALAAQDVVDYYQGLGRKIHRRVLTLPPEIFQGGRSALMGEIDMPKMTYEQILNAEGESPTVVPFRNGVLIALAAALAESLQFDWIYAGMHGDDSAHWNYPDCSPEVLGSLAAAIYIGTYHRVRLSFPLDFMAKWEVTVMGDRLNAPLWLTWSCYAPVKSNSSGSELFVHCGTCPTCIERHGAFIRANVHDPTHYLNIPEV